MFLKNYTSNVPVSETIHRIEKVLIRCGVSTISKVYGDGGEVLGLSFSVDLPGMSAVQIRLPVNKEQALQAMWLDYAGAEISKDGLECWNARKKMKRKDFAEQAERTSWKIMQDWVEVQMSMIQMQQAEFIQVFLPYVYDPRTKQTLFERIKTHNYKALLGSGEE